MAGTLTSSTKTVKFLNNERRGGRAINTHTATHELTPESAWHKSSYSGGTGNNCVEVASRADQVGIRDSKSKQGPALLVPATTWNTFVAFIAR
ncbi:DUF397 domain-containing protein [Streptomyces sp. NPDC005953]|uniref:DUF397 domain-containing protein n=1 Tax=Streptomyces sp. NPDC005953 TaxID=3156719 RepID=UPI0033F5061B